MIISEPNDFVAEVHDRMPVLLMPSQFEHWLSGNMGAEELRPAPNDYLHSGGPYRSASATRKPTRKMRR
jgi:putative SOS response-associated peptidase YedK